MSPPFMQLYVSDYLGDTRALTTEQHGAYLLLLMAAWNAGGRLPNDAKKLARFTGCTASRWARICPEVLAYFEVDGDEIVNARLSHEWRKASEKANQRAIVGAKGGAAKALKDKEEALAKATVLPCHSPEPDTIKKETTAVAVVARGRGPSKRCPADWQPRPETTVKLVAEGHTPDLMSREIEKFRDYTFATAKSDWDATWRNWVRNATPSRERPRSFLEIERERDDAQNRGALMALEIMKEKDRRNERPSQDGLPGGSCSALPQIEPNGSGAGALVVRLSDRLAGTLSRGG